MKHGLLLMSLPFVALLVGLALSPGPSAAESAEVTPLPPVEDLDGRAGVCFSYYPGDPDRPYLPLVHDVGSRWDRFDFIWPNIERTENGWHFDGYDDLVQDMSDAGMNVVGILLWTPDWAATGSPQAEPLSGAAERPSDWFAPSLMSPQAPSALSPSPPQGLYEAWDDWTTSDHDPINYWGRYVHTVVSRYSDPARFTRPVKHWEVWNEVDDGAWNYFWTGSEADYAQLLKVGYQATKAACPDCTVLYAGLLYWADQQYFERVLDILNDDPGAPANDYYFDAMSLHLYSRSSTVYDTVELIRSRMNTHVSDHPIWLTETGVMVWDDALVDPDPTEYDFAATQEEAAAYVIQSYANAWASRVERYFFFRANDQDMSEYFGLMRNDRSYRPSYAAYQVATTYLISPTMPATNWTYTDGTRRVTLWGTPRGKVSVLWNTQPDEVVFEYPAILPTATLVDRWGVTQTIQATAGAYTLTLPGATASLVSDPNDYIIGGEPYLVIEEDTVPPTMVAVRPLPPTTYSHTIQVAWEATDTDAGVWGFDVQVGRDADSWTNWLGFAKTAEWSGLYTDGEHGKTYCFRARAWDRAGNQGPWSNTERCTQLDLDRQVHLTVGAVFGDENGDGDQDEDLGEAGLDSLSFRLVDGSGLDVVTPSLGSSWEVTRTLRSGKYALLIEPQSWPSPPPGWLPRRITIDVPAGEMMWDLDHPSIGLLRHRSSNFLPLVGRNG